MTDQPKGAVSSFNPPETRLCLKMGSTMAWKVLRWASWQLKGFDLPEPKRGVLAHYLPETGGHVGPLNACSVPRPVLSTWDMAVKDR